MNELTQEDKEQIMKRERIDNMYKAFLDIIVNDLGIHPLIFHPDNDFADYVLDDDVTSEQRLLIPDTDEQIKWNTTMAFIDEYYNQQLNDPDAIYTIAMEYLGFPKEDIAEAKELTGEEILTKEG